jgi:SSS family solute:Na+ symporter
VIALYFGVLLCVAWWVVRKGKDSATDYFLAGRNLGWWIIGASIFASNIGSEHIVGLAGSGATSGVALAHYELHAWCLLVLGWVFVPFYMRSMVFTMPEFLERRFSDGLALCPLHHLDHHVHHFENRGRNLRGWRGLQHAAAGDASDASAESNIDSFWIGSVMVIVLTGLYTRWAACARWLITTPCRWDRADTGSFA